MMAGISACALCCMATAQEVPVVTLGDDIHLEKVLLAGPFPHPFVLDKGAPEGRPERGGFDVDYLVKFGGEAFGKIDGLAAIPFDKEDGTQGDAKVMLIDDWQLLNFQLLLTPDAYGMAYAVVDVEAKEDTPAVCCFGSDDFAKVWVNGELVHEVWSATSRGINPCGENFNVAFKKGRNRMVFKVEQKLGGWGIDVVLQSASVFAARQKEAALRAKADRFRNDALLLYDEEAMAFRGRMLQKGKLPSVVFQNTRLAAEMADMETLTVRWFGPSLDDVTEVTEPGFYCAFVEVKAKDGLVLRRVVPAYAPDKAVEWWRPMGVFNRDTNALAWHKELYPPVPEAAWNARGNVLRDTLNEALSSGWMHDDLPLLFADLNLDTAPADAWRIAPYVAIHDYLSQLRHKVMNRPPAHIIAPPVADASATALRAGTEVEAGFKPGAVGRIRVAAQQWADVSSNGFVLVVARRGAVILHEPFHGIKDAEDVEPAELRDGKLTTDSRLWAASITKIFTGVLLGRVIDQGLLSLDDPVSKYFPDFPANGEMCVTVRQLMNHTAGFYSGFWWFGLHGMANPFLDNAAWWQLNSPEIPRPFITYTANGARLVTPSAAALPGVRYHYNGQGFDLGGKIIEDITARSYFSTLRDALLEPLGQDAPFINNLGGGLACTAMDLARMADMLRQEGAYDGKRYFSRATFKSLLPMPIDVKETSLDYDMVDHAYGVGISWQRDRVGNTPDGDPILGQNVFGHGSATGAIFRVAPDLELVVTMARYNRGPDYEAHLNRLMQVIADNLAE